MGKKFSFTATVRDVRTGEAGTAQGQAEGDDTYTRERARADIQGWASTVPGRDLTATDIQLS
ncbi:hypothetical protein [Streptomyces sp. PSAA01]|uniref:hypothetical protein n=1 Tax=Streptomyces sp. PSAA01 TaxID=2912762 RepID=UPI001F305B17|nr:hypothetical protein [Streptomyces sp. PSAA01]MCG0286081.1 hypothetical protein [Streptomyces sp. PSAA01]